MGRVEITVGVVILLMQIGLLVGADYLFGEYAYIARETLYVYLIMEALVIAAFNTDLPTIEAQPSTMMNFVLMFVLTALVVSCIPSAMLASLAVIKLAIGFGILYAFVKAFVEEAIFRHILPDVAHLGHVISNVLFGLFHVFMLSMKPDSTAVSVVVGAVALMCLGFAWSLIKKRFGVLGSTGSHFAWNLHVFGVLGNLIGGA